MDEQQQQQEQQQQHQQQLQQQVLQEQLKNQVKQHILSSPPGIAWNLLGPLVIFVGVDSDIIIHGSFVTHESLTFYIAETKPPCVNEYHSYLSRKRKLFPALGTDISGLRILDKSDSIDDRDLALEDLIVNGSTRILVLQSALNMSESRATAAAYLPIFFESFMLATKRNSLYCPYYDDAVEFHIPIQYLCEQHDGNRSCTTALCNDLRPDIMLTVGRLRFPVAIVEIEIEKDKFSKDLQKAVGQSMASFRDIVFAARAVLNLKSSELNQNSMKFVNNCAKGEFVLPFATCHNDIVTFYCVYAKSLSENPSLEQNPFSVWKINAFTISVREGLICCAVYARNMVDYCYEVMGLHHWVDVYNENLLLGPDMMTASKLKQSRNTSTQPSNLTSSVTFPQQSKRQKTTVNTANQSLAQLEPHLTDMYSEIRGNHVIVFGTVSEGSSWLSHAVGEKVVVKAEIDIDGQIRNEIMIRSKLPDNDFIAPLVVDPVELMPGFNCLVMKNVGSTSSVPKTFLELKSVAEQLLKTIQFLHNLGFAHLDVKPSNIVLNWGPQNSVNVYLIDLGCAREIVDGECEDAFQCGTEYYRAPEVADESAVVGREADLYSIGKTLEEYSENVVLNGEEKKWMAKIIQVLTSANPSLRNVALSIIQYNSAISLFNVLDLPTVGDKNSEALSNNFLLKLTKAQNL